jgi:hypothetical protein
MADAVDEFRRLVTAVLRRWWAQNDQACAADGEVEAFGRQLWDVVNDRGLPRPLGPREAGAPGGMPEPECAPLVARVVRDLPPGLFAEPARQLLKTCLYPEFRICRDSFRETGADGICRRQQRSKARGRLSGVHCVDCPYWTDLAAPAHERFLAAEWCGDPAELRASRDVFLPEDFRALRQWLHAYVRTQL